MVGIVSCSEISFAILAGTASNSSMKQPASSMASASSRIFTADAAMKILEDALAIEDAGCFMLEFEAVPARIAKLISEQLTIPTIGIGAGVGCDGQILLCYDLLGVFTDFKPKFTKRFANLTEVALKAIAQYI